MNRYILRITMAFATIIALMATSPAYSQLDYFYGKNTSGLRVGAGVGLASLRTHYNTNPGELTYNGTLEYNFNPYLSIGVEGEYGTLKGIDTYNPGHLYYSSSTNQYREVNFNVKAGVGLLFDFYPQNKFQDAVKRLYIGVGYGVMKDKIALTTNEFKESAEYGTPQLYNYVPTVPFTIGTNIDLPNVLGYDRLEINPSYQFAFMNSMYSDGYISNQYSHLKGFYNLTSINIKFKF